MKSRRLSIIMMVCLIAVLCGLGTYVVYAAVNVSLTATNNIIFNTTDKIYYMASVNVKYENETTSLAFDSINHNGKFAEQNLAKTQMTFGNTLCFTNDHKTIVYEIIITNCGDKPLKVTINKPQDRENYTNTLDITTPVIIEQVANPDDVSKTATFKLTTHMTLSQNSFKFDNSFSIDLQTIE